MEVSILEATARLDDLVRQAEAGDEVVLTRDGRPVARLAAVEKQAETVEERRARLERLVASWTRPPTPGPSAARSQDFLYDDRGARVMVVDTSALMAVVLREPDAPPCMGALASASPLLMSAATLTEALIVAAGRDCLDEMNQLLTVAAPTVVDVSQPFALEAAAYRRWGKGFHPARLKFGDCFAYALAKQRGCPLLFVGGDFYLTDITPALPKP